MELGAGAGAGLPALVQTYDDIAEICSEISFHMFHATLTYVGGRVRVPGRPEPRSVLAARERAWRAGAAGRARAQVSPLLFRHMMI